MQADSSLIGVVRLNECAKTIRRYAFEVSLSALGAIVLSSRTGSELRGFNEVASQMRNWSRDLEAAVKTVTLLTTQRVRQVSDCLKQTRLQDLLRKAVRGSATDRHLRAGLALQDAALAKVHADLRQGDAVIADAIAEISQLGLMASVLSRAALIEAAGGSGSQRRELTLASQEFSRYAERVNEAVLTASAQYRGKQ
jgi:hypothetical protein